MPGQNVLFKPKKPSKSMNLPLIKLNRKVSFFHENNFPRKTKSIQYKLQISPFIMLVF